MFYSHSDGETSALCIVKIGVYTTMEKSTALVGKVSRKHLEINIPT